MKLLLIILAILLTQDALAVKRSMTARRHFMKTHVCPSTGKHSLKCPGYVVDHVCALASGGKDSPDNMQYQNVDDALAKDRIENTPVGVALYCQP